MATILITGGNGQLGSELKKISGQFSGYNFIFTDIAELDISDPTASNNFIAANKPEWIINCAAYNAVDKAETDFENALKINAGSGKKHRSRHIRNSNKVHTYLHRLRVRWK
jgi:dTDP-4-dehydrorhamnose reductase